MTCDTCGKELQVSEWPFCPHGFGVNTVVPDDIPGGQVFENGFETPQKFYSKSEHRRALDARGLHVVAKNAGPDDKICPRWDTVDLEAAAQLVQRGIQARQAKRDARWVENPMPISVRVLEGGVRATDL
jgi:hypothetical protein